jgi:hypothetical protein
MFANGSHPGSIDKQNLQDYVSTTQPKMGLFSSVKDSNDQFALLHQLPFRDGTTAPIDATCQMMSV